MAYRIEFSEDAESHYRQLTARQRSVLANAIQEQLSDQPAVPSVMRTVAIESGGSTLQTLLPSIAREEAVFLTVEGQVRFVVLPADEGDREVLAMRGNQRLMEFLDGCGQRARMGGVRHWNKCVRKTSR